MRERKVGLDGLCEAGLGQQRNDGGERLERVESPGTYLTE